MLLTVVHTIHEHCPSALIRPTIVAKASGEDGYRFADRQSPRNFQHRLLHKFSVLPFYLRFAALLDISGYSIGDPWGTSFAEGAVRNALRTRRLGGHYIHLPQAWGPFTSLDMRMTVRRLVGLCDLCYARDPTSLEALRSVVSPEDHPKLIIAPDIAWNFHGSDISVGRDQIVRAGLVDPEQKPIICVTPNMRVYERASGSGSDNEYVRVLTAIIEHLCNRWNVQVVLMGHELAEDNLLVPDDRVLCAMVLRSLDPSLPVKHLDRVLTAAQVKAVILNCSFVLSSRFHALIAAMSQHIPAATIGWSHKYPELMEEVGLPGNVLDTTLPLEVVIDMLDSILASKDDQRGILCKRVPEIQKHSAEMLETVMNRIFD